MALKFPGAKDGIALPFDLSSFAANGFTVAFWTRDPEKRSGYIINNNGNRGISLGLENLALRVDTDSKHRWYKSTPLEEQWQHVVLTFDGKIMRVYLGGREVGSSEIAGPLKLGKTTRIACGFSGIVDEFIVFQRALSADEVSRIHAVETYGPEAHSP